MERIDDERTLVKAKNLVVNGSKKGRPKKRWKDVTAKDMLIRGLKRMDAVHNACRINKPGFKRMKIFINTPGTNE